MEIYKKIVKHTNMVYNVPFQLKLGANMFYTGIGSRTTPQLVIDLMRKIGYVMAMRGYTLRSGGAEGADTAFADGWGDAFVTDFNSEGVSKYKAEIYLPWEGFNYQFSTTEGRLILDYEPAMEIVKNIHPNWDNLKSSVKYLHARNAHQVLGKDLETESEVVVFYAEPNGDSVKGGTRTAVELAKQCGIPVCNLHDPVVFQRWNLWVLRHSELKLGADE
jgi:hypothetical protein